jgi:hypothetical protein
MAKLSTRDKRYAMLLKRPTIKEGRVMFRKRPSHANKFMLAVFECEEEVHTVFYCMKPCVDRDGIPYLNVMFKDHVS